MKQFIQRPVFLLLVLLSFGSLATVAQPSKNFNITDFNEIVVSSGIDLYLTQAGSENIKLVGDEELIQNIEVEKKGNTLSIKYKEGMTWRRVFKGKSAKAYVSFKNLNSLVASGGSDVFTQNEIKSDKLNLRASGGSDLKLKVTVRDLDLRASGGSDVNLSGSATNMQISSSGGSDINAFDLIAENAKVTSSGGSDANVHVTKALEATASGGSDIHYKGDPSVRNNSPKYSGSVKRIR
eukprot:gene14900-18051_t